MSRRLKSACDQCRFRKLKCDNEQPCIRCSRLELSCSYEHIKTRSRRIAILRSRQLDPGNVHDALLADDLSGGYPPARTISELSHEDGSATSLVSQAPTESEEAVESGQLTFETNTVSESTREASSSLQRVPSPQNDANGRYRSTSSREASAIVQTNSALAGFAQDEMLPWVDVFLDRLYLTLPIVNRTTLYRDLMRGRQNEDSDFASMVLSMCALAMIQPVLQEEYASLPARVTTATEMLQAAIRMRNFDFGEDISIEGVIASFFMFAAFFGMGRHKTAWLRLRESVECGKFIGLHLPTTYVGLNSDMKGQRYRLLLILSVTERGYALQRNHTISITGKNIHDMKQMYLSVGIQALSPTQGIYIHDSKDITAVHGLLQLMKLFDAVDEIVIPCWNRSCAPTIQTCQKLKASHVEKVYYSIAEAFGPHEGSPWPDRPQALSPAQWADCFVLQQWLLMRLWVSCLTHDLLDNQSLRSFMRPSFVLDIAERATDEYESIGLEILEVHGSGMIERIHDIGLGVIMAAQGYQEVLDHRRARATLDTHLCLLRRFRDQGRPFTTALETAYRSIMD